jgi:hypothetical protein
MAIILRTVVLVITNCEFVDAALAQDLRSQPHCNESWYSDSHRFGPNGNPSVTCGGDNPCEPPNPPVCEPSDLIEVTGQEVSECLFIIRPCANSFQGSDMQRVHGRRIRRCWCK